MKKNIIIGLITIALLVSFTGCDEMLEVFYPEFGEGEGFIGRFTVDIEIGKSIRDNNQSYIDGAPVRVQLIPFFEKGGEGNYQVDLALSKIKDFNKNDFDNSPQGIITTEFFVDRGAQYAILVYLDTFNTETNEANGFLDPSEPSVMAKDPAKNFKFSLFNVEGEEIYTRAFLQSDTRASYEAPDIIAAFNEANSDVGDENLPPDHSTPNIPDIVEVDTPYTFTIDVWDDNDPVEDLYITWDINEVTGGIVSDYDQPKGYGLIELRDYIFDQTGDFELKVFIEDSAGQEASTDWIPFKVQSTTQGEEPLLSETGTLSMGVSVLVKADAEDYTFTNDGATRTFEVLLTGLTGDCGLYIDVYDETGTWFDWYEIDNNMDTSDESIMFDLDADYSIDVWIDAWEDSDWELNIYEIN